MEINSARPAVVEVASSAAASTEQVDRFNQRKVIEAQSDDVKSEAIYFSPVIRIDKDTQSTVIQYRDPNTGQVLQQYPHKSRVSAYEHAQDTAKASASSSDQDHVINVISDAAPQVQAPAKQDSSSAVSQSGSQAQAAPQQQAQQPAAVAPQPPVQKNQDPVVDQQA
jgi:hypothetical protein